MKFLTLILAAALLAGCEQTPESAQRANASDVAMPTNENRGRIRVERVGVISDPIAYSGKRGLYVITDNKTGQEFIGVSGVGVVETGSHHCGKACTREDER